LGTPPRNELDRVELQDRGKKNGAACPVVFDDLTIKPVDELVQRGLKRILCIRQLSAFAQRTRGTDLYPATYELASSEEKDGNESNTVSG
jgi:hypothetical protein